MDSGYIGYFDEIKSRSKAQQLDILAKARYEAFVVQRLVPKAMGCFLFSLLVAFLPACAVSIYFDLGVFFSGLIITVFLLPGLFVYRRLYGNLLHKGLKSVLSNIGADEPDILHE